MHTQTPGKPVAHPVQGVAATLLSIVIGGMLIAAVIAGWGLLREFWVFVIYWLQP